MATVSPFKARIRTIIRTNEMLERVHGKQVRVMKRVGAYGRGALRRMIRPPKSDRGATQSLRTAFGGQIRGRKVTIQSLAPWGKMQTLDVAVPVEGFGRVIDLRTGKQVSAQDAANARRMLRIMQGREGAGKPPRRGPTDKLRRFMEFETIEKRGLVTSRIGAYDFKQQPRLVGAISVPDLLERGGYEEIAGQLVRYEPHPFVAVARESTIKKMEQLIAQTPF